LQPGTSPGCSIRALPPMAKRHRRFPPRPEDQKGDREFI
jgi:hypothetical protein